MTPASHFAVQLGRLLGQQARNHSAAGSPRETLAELAAANSDSITLIWDNWQLRAGPDCLPASQPEILQLLSHMAAHGIRELSFDARTDSAHLLGVISILSSSPVVGDGGGSAVAKLHALGATTIRAVPVIQAAEAASSAPISPAAASSAAVTDPARPAGVDALVTALAGATTAAEITRILADMAALSDAPGRKIRDVVIMLLAVIDREPHITDPEASRAFRLGMKQIARPATFRALAAMLSTSPAERGDYLRIFAYFGDDAADELIEQLAHAESSAERRVLFDTLVELKRGVPTLIYLLGDGRWYVVRNAAELLGEMRAAEAEQGLAWLLSHSDQRVRQSATAALAKLETPGSRAALRNAIRDESRDVRMNATLALGMSKERGSVAVILRALADETDWDVQRTLMSALARIGTPEAVQYLMETAEPAAGLFKKKAMPLRVAAIEALAESQAPAAVAAVQALTKDKDREVRDAAVKALTPRVNVAVASDSRGGW